MAVPPTYVDLGKSAKDVFTKGYGKNQEATHTHSFNKHLQQSDTEIKGFNHNKILSWFWEAQYFTKLNFYLIVKQY